MNQKEEKAYVRGERAVATRILLECARTLGEEDPLRKAAVYIAEREQAIAALRELCAEHGDNDWPDNLRLAYIISKHLGRHLGSSK
jgi:predicted secreted protein